MHTPDLSPDGLPADSAHGKRRTCALADEAQTADFARRLAPLLVPGMVVWLDGDLGAGKTTLVRALLRALGSS